MVIRWEFSANGNMMNVPLLQAQKKAQTALRFFDEKKKLQTENDEPQPQVLVAPGFLMTNCAPSRSSL